MPSSVRTRLRARLRLTRVGHYESSDEVAPYDVAVRYYSEVPESMHGPETFEIRQIHQRGFLFVPLREAAEAKDLHLGSSSRRLPIFISEAGLRATGRRVMFVA